jgi:hypothetical protein
VLSIYMLVAIPPSLITLAVILVVIRADQKDLPAIVSAITGIGPGDDDTGNNPPSLPKSLAGPDMTTARHLATPGQSLDPSHLTAKGSR